MEENRFPPQNRHRNGSFVRGPNEFACGPGRQPTRRSRVVIYEACEIYADENCFPRVRVCVCLCAAPWQ